MTLAILKEKNPRDIVASISIATGILSFCVLIYFYYKDEPQYDIYQYIANGFLIISIFIYFYRKFIASKHKIDGSFSIDENLVEIKDNTGNFKYTKQDIESINLNLFFNEYQPNKILFPMTSKRTSRTLNSDGSGNYVYIKTSEKTYNLEVLIKTTEQLHRLSEMIKKYK